MELIDEKETYEFVIDTGEGENNPVFIMGKLTTWEHDMIDDRSTLTTTSTGGDGIKAGEVRYLSGTIRSLKIEYAVKDWRNVVAKDGKPAKCNKENKKKLPVGIREKIVKHIDEINELNKGGDEEDKKVKN